MEFYITGYYNVMCLVKGNTGCFVEVFGLYAVGLILILAERLA